MPHNRIDLAPSRHHVYKQWLNSHNNNNNNNNDNNNNNKDICKAPNAKASKHIKRTTKYTMSE